MLKTGINFFVITYGLIIFFASGFVQPNYILGPVLFFPIITSVIAKGLLVLFSVAKNGFKNNE